MTSATSTTHPLATFRPSLLLEIVLLASVYFVAARLGLGMAEAAPQVSAVWPVTGIALAWLVLRGKRLWPGVFLGAFAANVLAPAPLMAAVGIATGNTLEALLGALLLERMHFSPALKRLRDVAALFVLAAGLSTMVSASIGVASLCLTGVVPWSAYPKLWGVWWTGDAVGNLIVAPLIFTWVWQTRCGWQAQRWAETLVLVAGLALLSAVVFVAPGATAASSWPVHYLIFPAIIWTALRLGQHVSSAIATGALGVSIVATLSGRGPFVMESVNASLLHVALYMSVVAATGLFLGAAMAERNRSERQRALDYARLRSSEERLALALAAGKMGAWEWDIATGKVEWSRTVEDLHGMRAGTFGGTFEDFRNLIHPEDKERVLAAIERAVEGTADYDIEFRHLRGDGSVHWIATRAQVVRDGKRAVRMVGIVLDITERKHTHDALRHQAAQLAEADRHKDEFLAVLGHELRNPLAPIQNALGLLSYRPDDAAVITQAREIMERQLKHLVRLVDELLDVSRIRSGKIILSRSHVEFAPLVRSAIELSQPMIDARRHRLIVQLPEKPLWLKVDPIRIPQLLANLLNNSAKYTEEGGSITLSAEYTDRELTVRIKDTGIGMTPEVLARVFELFVQADGATHAIQGGLGVGLSLARSLAELHGGSLTAHSEGPGRGSEFMLRLPLDA